MLKNEGKEDNNSSGGAAGHGETVYVCRTMIDSKSSMLEKNISSSVAAIFFFCDHFILSAVLCMR